MANQEVEYPAYHQQGLGCGLEDQGITDRYEAMQYGWDEAIDRCATEVVDPLLAEIYQLKKIISKLVDECLASDFSEHWDSFKDAEVITEGIYQRWV